jgi:hypothetical protein
MRLFLYAIRISSPLWITFATNVLRWAYVATAVPALQ